MKKIILLILTTAILFGTILLPSTIANQKAKETIIEKDSSKPLGPLLGKWPVASVDGSLYFLEKFSYTFIKKVGNYYLYKDVEILGMVLHKYDFTVGNIIKFNPEGPITFSAALLFNKYQLPDGLYDDIGFDAIGFNVRSFKTEV